VGQLVAVIMSARLFGGTVRDVFVDVLLEVPARELLMLDDPTRAVWERMRQAADAKCAQAGARLRTDRAPEVLVQEARHPLAVT
jgi:hypothetical protein